MSRKEKTKLVLFLLGMLLLIGVFWLILQQIEENYPSAQTSKDFIEDDRFQDIMSAGFDVEKTGSITLDGVRYDYFHEFESYLLIGTDNSGNEQGRGKRYQGNMADFLLLLVLDKTEQKYHFLQLNRDTITEVTLLQKDNSGMASADIQLCTAHWYGGNPQQSSENTVNAVSNLLGGVPITGYYTINMEHIPALNHAVGGVTVTIEDDFSKVAPEMEQGKTIKLNDKQAYLYVHDRYSVGDEQNLSRMKRQRQYMEAYIDEVMTKSKQNPEFINELYHSMEEYTVTNIRGKEISQIVNMVKKGTGTGVHTFEGTSKVGKILGDGIDHTEFFIDKKSMQKILTSLYGLKRG